MVFAVVKSRWVITACLIIAILTLVSLVFNGKQPDLGIARDLNQRSVAAPVYGIAGGNIKKVAVSFGQNSFEESPNRLQIPAKNGHGSSSKRAYPDTLSYAKAVENGKKYLGIIEKASQEPVWTKADFDESGWTLNSNYPRTIANELIVPAQEKGISTNAADINKIAAQQFSEFTNMDCERQDVSRAIQFSTTQRR
ncbi:MAG: hypothetical protein L6R42_006106 [Xanthoria sp. 1 TBL-2021]|nr:MAG: hypothetical protein L6R42_006106 [Xanthoria sp. 1 TBL-2021]